MTATFCASRPGRGRRPRRGPSRTATAPLALVVLLPLAACGDDGGRGTTAPPEVAQVVLEAAVGELELGDSTQLTARVLGTSGQELTGRTITWRSSNEAVLRVSQTGMVTGVGPGTASITATVEARSATVSLTVLDYNIAEEVQVVDSTQLRLVSDSAERATGRLRFQVLSGSPPPFAPGEIIVGTEDGGFLRRVTSVSVSGDQVTLETEPAALADAIETGSFSTTIDLLFEPGLPASAIGPAMARLGPGDVVWGEGRFTYLAPGMTPLPAASGFNLSDVDICELLAFGSSVGTDKCPEGLKTFKIKSGRLQFEPDLEVKADFEGFSLKEFRGVAKGSLTNELILELEAAGGLDLFEATPTFFTFTRPFYIQLGAVPVIGYVELQLTGELSLSASAKGSLEAGFTATASVEVGAEYRNEQWTSIFGGDSNFDPHTPSVSDSTLSAAIEITAKVAMKPRLQLIFYGVVGPFVEAAPYGEATLSFGATCGFSLSTAIDAAIGFTVPFLDDDVADFAERKEPLIEGPSANWPCPLGTINVTTVTEGEDPDPDGYTILLDGEEKGSIGPNGQLSIPNVPQGERQLTLSGVAPNCTVQDGATRTLTVAAGLERNIDFTIHCTALTGEIEVTASTTGSALDPDGYTVTIDGVSSGRIDPNGTLLFENVAQGEHLVGLSGIESNCAVSGDNPVSVQVKANERATVSFHVSCAATELIVSTHTTGPPADTSGWTVTLDGAETRSITPNGQVAFSTTPGLHNIELEGLPDNCTVVGNNPTVVDVAPTGQTHHTFEVECQAAGLTVSVATDTTDSGIDPNTTYTVVAGGQSKTVGLDGVVVFDDLPKGTISVALQDVPVNCTVQGQNPRDVEVPGTTSFEVVCQQATACSAVGEPPEPVWFEVVTYPRPEEEGWEGESGSVEIFEADYGRAHIWATASEESTGILSRSYGATVKLDDYINLIPVDPARMGDTIYFRYQTSFWGQFSADADTLDPWQTGSARAALYQQVRPWPPTVEQAASTYKAGFARQSAYDHPLQLDTVEVFSVKLRLGDWFYLHSRLDVIVNARKGTYTMEGRYSIEFLDVVDQDGNIVPIKEICTALGATYLPVSESAAGIAPKTTGVAPVKRFNTAPRKKRP